MGEYEPQSRSWRRDLRQSGSEYYNLSHRSQNPFNGLSMKRLNENKFWEKIYRLLAHDATLFAWCLVLVKDVFFGSFFFLRYHVLTFSEAEKVVCIGSKQFYFDFHFDPYHEKDVMFGSIEFFTVVCISTRTFFWTCFHGSLS